MISWFHRRPKSLTVIEAYTRWAAAYPPEAHNALMELEERAMLEVWPAVTGCRVLDVACGSGRYLRHLRTRGAAQAVGIDLTPAMLLRAQAEYPYLAQANLITLPFAAATFDFVVCGLALGHIPDLSAALSELARVLKPQGMLFYSDVHPLGALAGWQRTFEVQGQTYTMPHHIHLYQDHLAAYRAASLVVEDVREPRLGADTPAPGWPAALVVRAKKPKGRGFDPDV